MPADRRPAVLLAAFVLAGCERSGSETAAPWFREAASTSGIRFVYHAGHRDRYHMPEIMGGGAALFDMDGDGDLDAYLVQGGRVTDDLANPPANLLLENDGGGRFTDVTAGSGAGDTGYGMGVACGDCDGDGDVDLYVTNVGMNALLRNDGGGRFTDVTADAGVGAEGWSTSAAFLDHDDDGDLDLFVCSYLAWSPQLELECFNTMGGTDYCSPRHYQAPAQDRLFRNDGTGRFTDVTEAAGLTSFSGTGLGVVCGDFTGDGRVDLFVANDGMRDQLWVSGEDDRFVDKALEYGSAYDRDGREAAGMGVTAMDLDADGFEEVLVGNLRNESDSFFRNQRGERFANGTAAAGLAAVSRRYTRFGQAFVDFDHDGIADLFQANGRVMQQADLHSDDPYAEPNLLYRGRPGGRFAVLEPAGGTDPPLIGSARGAAFGDVNGDGAIDVLIVNRDGPAHLMINQTPNRGEWIMLDVRDASGAPALGAVVAMTVGERRVTRTVRAAYSYCASNDPRVHVGLGDAGGVTDVVVTWPGGTEDRFGDRTAGAVYVLRRGAGAP